MAVRAPDALKGSQGNKYGQWIQERKPNGVDQKGHLGAHLPCCTWRAQTVEGAISYLLAALNPGKMGKVCTVWPPPRLHPSQVGRGGLGLSPALPIRTEGST